MKGNRPKIHGNSPKNGQKMKQKHIKNALSRVKFWSKCSKTTEKQSKAAKNFKN